MKKPSSPRSIHDLNIEKLVQKHIKGFRNVDWEKFKKLTATEDISLNLPRHSTKKYKQTPIKKKKRIIVHCTDRNWSVYQVADYDVNGFLNYKRFDGKTVTETNHISSKGLPGITYHDVVAPGGVVYHTLPYEENSYQAAGYNSTSVAIALLYRATNPKTNRDEFGPSKMMIHALYYKLALMCLDLDILPEKIFGHRELRGTGWKLIDGKRRLLKTCPGLQVDMNEVRDNVTKLVQILLKEEKLYKGSIDGLFGSNSKAAFQLYIERKK